MQSGQEHIAPQFAHKTPPATQATPQATRPTDQRRALAWRPLLFLTVGHVFNDLNQGAVPALLPFLFVPFGLTFTTAGLLTLAATVTSSLIQPLFGALSDRRPLPWLVPLGIGLGGIALGVIGFVPPHASAGYALLLVCVALSGLGVAAFHPDGARYANYVSGSKRGSGMSIFAVGGNLGFALGPLLVTLCLALGGLRGIVLLAVPGVVVACVLLRVFPSISTFHPGATDLSPRPHADTPADLSPRAAAVSQAWGPFAVLTLVVGLRSIAYFGLLTFAPLYAIATLGSGKDGAELLLTAMLVVAAGGTLLTGRLSDRVGRRLAIVGPLALATPLLLGFAASGGEGWRALGFLALILGGAANVAPFNVMVVLGQEYLSRHLGVASGVTMGLGIGIGGVGAAVFGGVADHFGLGATLAIIALLPLLGALLALVALPLPKAGDGTASR